MQDIFLKMLVTWFGSGLLKPASGTWGSLASLPFAYLILKYSDRNILLLASVIIFVLGVILSNLYIKGDKTKDPSEVVIDEVAGQWFTLFFISSICLSEFIIGFILFRIFDALKPFPISWCDKNLKGGFGIMFDDMVAGLFAGILLYLYNRFIGYTPF